MQRLSGRVALITGGASGIGRACAQRLRDEGAGAVIVGDRQQASREDLATLGSGGTRAAGVILDVSDAQSCARTIDEIVSEFGKLDIVVHSAGINYGAYAKESSKPPDRTKRPDILSMDFEYWSRMLDVNLSGTMHVNRSAGRHMVKANKGSIINITSIDAVRAVGGNTPYCVSKAAAWMFTKCFALELKTTGVRVNAIAPGYIETAMSAGLRENPALLTHVLNEIPMGKLGSVEQAAAAAAYLASDDSAYITGSVITLDGGVGAAFR